MVVLYPLAIVSSIVPIPVFSRVGTIARTIVSGYKITQDNVLFIPSSTVVSISAILFPSQISGHVQYLWGFSLNVVLSDRIFASGVPGCV